MKHVLCLLAVLLVASIEVNGRWQLARVVSHKLATGTDFRCCRYGQVTYKVRISRNADWIDSAVTKY